MIETADGERDEMDIAIVTGSAGLVGSAAVELFAGSGFETVGIDNDMRRRFFGETASTSGNLRRLMSRVPGYRHHDVDIRDDAALRRIFETYGSDIRCVIHTAAQPSHDWAARDPTTTSTSMPGRRSFSSRRGPQSRSNFVFTSTNKSTETAKRAPGRGETASTSSRSPVP
jgi:CDP-paratose 2-epimerase